MSNQDFSHTIIITGGAGFIGSHVVRRFVENYPDSLIVNVDLLTYAGNPDNLAGLENRTNYRFERADVASPEAIREIFKKYRPDGVIHLAAESHVDRSITDPLAFVKSNVFGTINMLQCAREAWEPKGYEGKKFYQISTDEVYGALEPGDGKFFTEDTAYSPHSPYSASKASADHFVRAYHDTYGMPTVISCCSNNYGPNQFPEKLIPLFLTNIREGKPLPVYGKGENIRDWLYVGDHAEAIDIIFHKGEPGQRYNIGGHNEWRNIDLVKELIRIADEELGNAPGTSEKLITFVTDRKGHDLRYAIDPTKTRDMLGWEPHTVFNEGLRSTIKWYLENPEWTRRILSGEYRAGLD